ncbi:hypothetical protein [Verrucomicrobium spinosum]|uniref:hypothetical protein n=1 Tax=Verrucomicrobium spinosum TaxID=2736 RepID=UPI000A4D67DE|nr:hypothetical protein [Verrucomicrobium spinosum]
MNLLFRRKNEPSRRQFLVQTGCSAMGITSVVNTLAHLKLMQGALNAQSGGSGYKALVCVFLNGGNDSNNMLLPFTGTARTDYEAGRGVLTIPTANANAALNALQINATNVAESDPLGGYLGTFGVHPKFNHVKTMFDTGELAFVANVGTLTQPGVTRANYATASKLRSCFRTRTSRCSGRAPSQTSPSPAAGAVVSRTCSTRCTTPPRGMLPCRSPSPA